MADLRRRAGGSIFVRTGNHGNGVDRTVPEMRRMEECSWASTRLTCVERCHTGQQVLSVMMRHILTVNSLVSQWLCALLCRGYNYDSTSIRRPFDCLSKVIKVTVT